MPLIELFTVIGAPRERVVDLAPVGMIIRFCPSLFVRVVLGLEIVDLHNPEWLLPLLKTLWRGGVPRHGIFYPLKRLRAERVR